MSVQPDLVEEIPAASFTGEPGSICIGGFGDGRFGMMLWLVGMRGLVVFVQSGFSLVRFDTEGALVNLTGKLVWDHRGRVVIRFIRVDVYVVVIQVGSLIEDFLTQAAGFGFSSCFSRGRWV